MPGASSSRRTERLERRELLYSIVRECMTQSGVLSSKYKFKVLSLDSKGREYLIMIDLPKENAVEARGLTDIEGLIARNAKNRHGILVTAVYWRVVEQVMTALKPSRLQRQSRPNRCPLCLSRNCSANTDASASAPPFCRFRQKR